MQATLPLCRLQVLQLMAKQTMLDKLEIKQQRCSDRTRRRWSAFRQLPAQESPSQPRDTTRQQSTKQLLPAIFHIKTVIEPGWVGHWERRTVCVHCFAALVGSMRSPVSRQRVEISCLRHNPRWFPQHKQCEPTMCLACAVHASHSRRSRVKALSHLYINNRFDMGICAPPEQGNHAYRSTGICNDQQQRTFQDVIALPRVSWSVLLQGKQGITRCATACRFSIPRTGRTGPRRQGDEFLCLPGK